MRLLDTETGHFVEFTDPTKVHYAILSHTWDPCGEQTYQEIKEIQKPFTPRVRRLSISPTLRNSSHHDDVDERTPLLRDQVDMMEQGRLPASVPQTFPAKFEGPLPIRRAFWRLWRLLVAVIVQVFVLAQCIGVRRSEQSDEPPSSAPHSLKIPCTTAIWDDARLSEKVRKACAIARAHGYRYIWIDSCCIDKGSSSELSEAINSMYPWYRDAVVCYAYLADVQELDDPRADDSYFRASKWFTRGWTLQELIAPRDVVFLSKDWRVIGSKASLVAVVEEITGIDRPVLTHRMPLDQVSVARRMSWAARRETTRVEDEAYALLGIFDINMPTLYGEGRRAFVRLQEEILKRIPDQSLFAWGEAYLGPLPIQFADDPIDTDLPTRFSCHKTNSSLFASSPWAFHRAGNIVAVPHDALLRRLSQHDIAVPEYAHSPYGIRTTFPLLSIDHRGYLSGSIILRGSAEAQRYYLAILACEHSDLPGHLLARVCYSQPFQSNLELLKAGYLRVSAPGCSPELLTLSPDQIERYRTKMHLKTIYIPHLKGVTDAQRLLPPPFRRDLSVLLSRWCAAVLHSQGYDVAFRSPCRPGRDPNLYACGAILSKDDDTINVEYMYRRGGNYNMQVCVVVSAFCPDSTGLVQRDGPFSSGWFLWPLSKGRRLEFGEVNLSLRSGDGESVTMRVGLEFMSVLEPSCHLRIEITDDET